MHDQTPPLIDSPALQRYGWPELVYVASPAAGAATTIKVDGNYIVQPLAVYFKLSTDANVPDRYAQVDYLDADDNIFLSNVAGQDITANADVFASFSRWAPALDRTAEIRMTVPLAATLLLPTWKIQIGAFQLQAGDQISQVRILWQRYFTFGDR